jgi:hypothetical protein
MGNNNWWDLMVALYLIALNDKKNSVKVIDCLLKNNYYPAEIKQALEMFKKGFEEK